MDVENSLIYSYISDIYSELYSNSGNINDCNSIKFVCSILKISKITYMLNVNGNVNDTVTIYEDLNLDTDSYSDFFRKTNLNRVLTLRVSRFSQNEEMTESSSSLLNIFSNILLNKICIDLLINSRDHALYYDELTETTNSSYYTMIINKLINMEEINEYYTGVLNIKSCHTMNSLFGNHITEKLISKYAQTIQSFCNNDIYETFSHLGGDTFAFIIHKDNIDNFATKIQNIHTVVTSKDDTLEYNILCRAGIIRCNSSQTSPSEILGRAMSIYKKTRMPEYDDILIVEDSNQQNIDHSFIRDFKNDFEADKFLVYYQPVYANDDKLHIVSAEALIRWRRSGEMVSPSDFIPIAEKLNLITDIDLFVLNKACETLRNWIDNNIPVVPISVNFSYLDLNNRNIAESIIETIDKNNIPHNLITIEFKEAGYHQEYETLSYTIKTLKSNGVSVGIDNFGIGYSSFSLLKDLDIDFLKLSSNIVNSSNDKTIIVLESIINLAHKLSISVICQGMDNTDLIEQLKSYGCHHFQTELYSKALSERFFVNQLKNQ